MVQEKHRERLLARFPYLFPAALQVDLRSSDPRLVAPAEVQLLDGLVRFLGGLFLRQVLAHGVSDERIAEFVDQGLNAPTLAAWVEFQRLVLEERRVPFEEVFSLDFKRRDLLLLLNRKYLDYLEALETQLKSPPGADGGLTAETATVFAELADFVVTYFKSELSAAAGGGLVLLSRDKNEILNLYPIFRGSLEAVEILSGLTSDGVAYLSFADQRRREVRELAVLDRLGEAFLRVGAYRQAIATFEKIARLGQGGPQGPQSTGALYASHCYLGLECYRKGKFHQAIVEFEKAMALRADMPQLHYNLALAYARLNNAAKATQILLKLVETHPDVDRGFELLGDLFLMKTDKATARKMYDKALMNNPYNKAVERKRRGLVEEVAPIPAPAAAAAASAEKKAEEEPRAHDLLLDLTQMAADGKLRSIIGRDDKLAEMVEILCCEARSNPILIGEPGVGKSAIVEELALRLARGQVPPRLKGKKLYLMSVATLLAGAKFRGQFEERILGLIKELKSERCLLFIDDIHTIVNSGLSKGGTLDTSNLLKPALIRGEIQVIGATNFDEYRNNIEKDPSLVRCFQMVNVDEPGPEEMVGILQSHLRRLGVHHGVRYEEMDLAGIARLVSICLRELRLPDAAVTVIDRAAARAALRAGEAADTDPVVRRDDVVAVVAEMSGVPVTKLSAAETERFVRAEDILAERVVGQDEALAAVSRVLRTTRLDLDLSSRRPKGVFLFVGPTGVGKTELARAMAEFLFGDEEKMIRIDMSEYMDKIASSRLIGTAPGYVGYNDQNQLTDQVRKQPYCLVLLDEIEKADGQMLNLFLQVFDAGRLTDGKGRTVHFNNTTMVMTSNIGTQLYGQSRAGYAADGSRARAVSRGELMKEVKRYFPPEFLNRIDEVVFFRPLDTTDLARIARLQLTGLVARLAKQGIEFTVEDEVYEILVREGVSAEYGARNLARVIRRRVLDPLAVVALNAPWERVRRAVVAARDGARIEVTLSLQGDLEIDAIELTGAGQLDLEAQE